MRATMATSSACSPSHFAHPSDPQETTNNENDSKTKSLSSEASGFTSNCQEAVKSTNISSPVSFNGESQNQNSHKGDFVLDNLGRGKEDSDDDADKDGRGNDDVVANMDHKATSSDRIGNRDVKGCCIYGTETNFGSVQKDFGSQSYFSKNSCDSFHTNIGNTRAAADDNNAQNLCITNESFGSQKESSICTFTNNNSNNKYALGQQDLQFATRDIPSNNTFNNNFIPNNATSVQEKGTLAQSKTNDGGESPYSSASNQSETAGGLAADFSEQKTCMRQKFNSAHCSGGAALFPSSDDGDGNRVAASTSLLVSERAQGNRRLDDRMLMLQQKHRLEVTDALQKSIYSDNGSSRATYSPRPASVAGLQRDAQSASAPAMFDTTHQTVRVPLYRRKPVLTWFFWEEKNTMVFQIEVPEKQSSPPRVHCCDPISETSTPTLSPLAAGNAIPPFSNTSDGQNHFVSDLRYDGLKAPQFMMQHRKIQALQQNAPLYSPTPVSRMISINQSDGMLSQFNLHHRFADDPQQVQQHKTQLQSSYPLQQRLQPGAQSGFFESNPEQNSSSPFQQQYAASFNHQLAAQLQNGGLEWSSGQPSCRDKKYGKINHPNEAVSPGQQGLRPGQFHYDVSPETFGISTFGNGDESPLVSECTRVIYLCRRQDNNYINGTKLLNVAGMSRGKRDSILKNEKSREVVKSGSMRVKGVWIPLDRAIELANGCGILERVAHLLNLHPTYMSMILRSACVIHSPLISANAVNNGNLINGNSASSMEYSYTGSAVSMANGHSAPISALYTAKPNSYGNSSVGNTIAIGGVTNSDRNSNGEVFYSGNNNNSSSNSPVSSNADGSYCNGNNHESSATHPPKPYGNSHSVAYGGYQYSNNYHAYHGSVVRANLTETPSAQQKFFVQEQYSTPPTNESAQFAKQRFVTPYYDGKGMQAVHSVGSTPVSANSSMMSTPSFNARIIVPSPANLPLQNRVPGGASARLNEYSQHAGMKRELDPHSFGQHVPTPKKTQDSMSQSPFFYSAIISPSSTGYPTFSVRQKSAQNQFNRMLQPQQNSAQYQPGLPPNLQHLNNPNSGIAGSRQNEMNGCYRFQGKQHEMHQQQGRCGSQSHSVPMVLSASVLNSASPASTCSSSVSLSQPVSSSTPSTLQSQSLTMNPFEPPGYMSYQQHSITSPAVTPLESTAPTFAQSNASNPHSSYHQISSAAGYQQGARTNTSVSPTGSEGSVTSANVPSNIQHASIGSNSANNGNGYTLTCNSSPNSSNGNRSHGCVSSNSSSSSNKSTAADSDTSGNSSVLTLKHNENAKVEEGYSSGSFSQSGATIDSQYNNSYNRNGPSELNGQDSNMRMAQMHSLANLSSPRYTTLPASCTEIVTPQGANNPASEPTTIKSHNVNPGCIQKNNAQFIANNEFMMDRTTNTFDKESQAALLSPMQMPLRQNSNLYNSNNNAGGYEAAALPRGTQSVQGNSAIKSEYGNTSVRRHNDTDFSSPSSEIQFDAMGAACGSEKHDFTLVDNTNSMLSPQSVPVFSSSQPLEQFTRMDKERHALTLGVKDRLQMTNMQGSDAMIPQSCTNAQQAYDSTHQGFSRPSPQGGPKQLSPSSKSIGGDAAVTNCVDTQTVRQQHMNQNARPPQYFCSPTHSMSPSYHNLNGLLQQQTSHGSAVPSGTVANMRDQSNNSTWINSSTPPSAPSTLYNNSSFHVAQSNRTTSSSDLSVPVSSGGSLVPNQSQAQYSQQMPRGPWNSRHPDSRARVFASQRQSGSGVYFSKGQRNINCPSESQDQPSI